MRIKLNNKVNGRMLLHTNGNLLPGNLFRKQRLPVAPTEVQARHDTTDAII
jgi:hypothetical protein